MFNHFISDLNTSPILILFSARPNWYLLFQFQYFQLFQFLFLGYDTTPSAQYAKHFSSGIRLQIFKKNMRGNHQKTVR